MSKAGYPIDWFVDSHDQLANYICPFCMDICRDAQQCKNGHLFCCYCVTKAHLKSLKCCPSCRTGKLTSEHVHNNSFARKDILQFKVRCVCYSPHNAGCGWIGTLSRRQDRDKVCPVLLKISSTATESVLVSLFPSINSETENDCERQQYESGRLLVDEVLGHATNYNTIFANLVPDLINMNGLVGISMPVKLALAMVFAGSMKRHLFMLAFKLVSEFESLGDCYWVVQLEFLRHSAIEKIRYGSMLHESTTITLQSQGFSSNGTFHADDVYNRLNEVFSIDGKEVFPVNSRCVVLAQNTVSLKQEIDDLILVIDQNANPRKIFDAYLEKFPLKSFVEWFLLWAGSFLKTVEKKLNSKHRSFFPSDHFVKINMSTREQFRVDLQMSPEGLCLLMGDISNTA